MRLLHILLAVLFVGLQYSFWFGDNGYVENQRLDQELLAQSAAVEAQQRINEALGNQVLDLKSGLDATEELARQNLGLIKEGETFILIIEE